jgi:hypothetical protein
MTILFRLIAATALTLLLGLSAGCGADPHDDSALPDASGTSSQDPAGDDEADLDPEDALLKYAQCMRDHGVDMPDPEPGGGIQIDGRGIPEDTMDAANAACQKWMDIAEPEDAGDALSEEEKQSFLDMAACMRDRGWNYPDPTFDGGRVSQQIEKGEGEGAVPEKDDPAFKKDTEECSAEAGMEAPGEGAGGSTDEQQG